MVARALRKFADHVPEHRNWVFTVLLLLVLSCATPVVGLFSRLYRPAERWLPGGALIPETVLGITCAGLVLLLISKLAVNGDWWIARIKRAAKKMEIALGGMTFSEKALFTNLLAFGSIGSGKTAAVIYPILDSITALYKNDDPTEPDAKWGGFVLDVKGDFHEAVIFTMQKHGRDALDDLVVIRPDNDYYVLDLEDLSTGNHFLVSCMGGTTLQECDLILKTATGPQDVLSADESGNKCILLPNGDREPLSSFMFSDRGTFRRPEVHKLLSQLEFDATGKSIRWIGWREDRGGKLIRVKNTVKRETIFAKDSSGRSITVSKPGRMRYCGVHSINNGLTYNLISRTAASTEAAGRIMAVAEVTGNSMGGDNAYWSNASEKHIAHCIELFRQVEGPMGAECSVNEIQRFTSNDEFCTAYVKKLIALIEQKQRMGASDYEILLLRNLQEYFQGEWGRLDPKTRGNIQSCVTNLFGDVTRNEQLLKTFCQPSRFSFEDCLNNGKVYTLVLSAYPNAQMLIGTCMKLDFQQVVLKRTQAAPVNKNRFLAFVADEYQYFITTSGGSKTGGDEKFLSVARQSRIFNLVCTQAKTSLLAVQKDENKIDAFIQCFGSRVFLQNLDDKTNKLAETVLGQFWGEKTDFSGPDLKLSSALGEGKSGNISRRQEKMHRFDASHFTQMAEFEAVIFNKERPPGKKMVKTNLRKEACFFDKKDLAMAANDYYQAYIENRAQLLGIGHLFDVKDNVQLENPAEKKQRSNNTLRSWRGGLPIGMCSGGTAIATAVATPVPVFAPSEDGEFDATGKPSGAEQDTLAKLQDILPNPPTAEQSFAYLGQEPGISDLEAAKACDPFADDVTEVNVGTNEPVEPEAEILGGGDENPSDPLEQGLKELKETKPVGVEKAEEPPEPSKRIMLNRTDVRDGVTLTESDVDDPFSGSHLEDPTPKH